MLIMLTLLFKQLLLLSLLLYSLNLSIKFNNCKIIVTIIVETEIEIVTISKIRRRSNSITTKNRL